MTTGFGRLDDVEHARLRREVAVLVDAGGSTFGQAAFGAEILDALVTECGSLAGLATLDGTQREIEASKEYTASRFEK